MNKDYEDYLDSIQGQPHDCVHCDEHDQELNQIKDWFEEVVYELYEGGNLNNLEYAIEELSGYLNVKLPAALCKFQRREGPYEILAKQLQQPLFKGNA